MKRKAPIKRKAWLKAKPSKFGAKKTRSRVFDNRLFDSKGEKERAEDLAWQQKRGLIRLLELQPQLVLTEAKITYKPDFSYMPLSGPMDRRMVYEDFKGVETERFRIIKKLWKVYGPGPLLITKKRKDGSFVVTETIVP